MRISSRLPLDKQTRRAVEALAFDASAEYAVVYREASSLWATFLKRDGSGAYVVIGRRRIKDVL